MKTIDRDESIRGIAIWEDGSMKVLMPQSQAVVPVRLDGKERRMVRNFRMNCIEEETTDDPMYPMR